MDVFKLAATLLPVSLLGSCVYMPDMLPDMPYSGSLKTEKPTATPAPEQQSSSFFGQKSPLQQVQQQPTPKTPAIPAATPAPTIPSATTMPPTATTVPSNAAATIPGAVVQPTAPVVQAPQPATKPASSPASTTITSGSAKVQPVIAPQPKAVVAPKVTAPKVTSPKPASTAEPTAAAKAAPKPATTPAPVAKPEVKVADTPPVASRVPGDPFRVYNPYEPSKTILIKGANGQPFPSGKKLKIQGTDKYFIVP